MGPQYGPGMWLCVPAKLPERPEKSLGPILTTKKFAHSRFMEFCDDRLRDSDSQCDEEDVHREFEECWHCIFRAVRADNS